MVKYLSLDGVDDRLTTDVTLPSNFEVETTFVNNVNDTSEHVIFSQFLAGSVGRFAFSIIQNKLRIFLGGISGTTEQYGSTTLIKGTKYKVKISIINNAAKIYLNDVLDGSRTFSASLSQSAKMWIGASSFNNGSAFAPIDIYSFKATDTNNVLLYYDMSLGNVQDQSGNGNHATLTGGTWLDDGAGGSEPVGTDGSITLGLTQQIYSDSSVNLSLTQQIYAEISANLNLIQSIYKDTEAVLNLSQAIYRDSEIGLNLRQEIYAEAESILNLIQEFYEDSQTYITLQLVQQIYKDSSTDLPMIQAVYRDSEMGLPLRQEMYEEKEASLNLAQTIYKDDSSVLNLTQTIYRDSQQTLNLVQQMYTEGEISLPLLIQIRDDLVNLIGLIRLVGKRVLNIPLQGKRELNVTLLGGIDVTAINQNFSMIAGDTKNLVVTLPEDVTGCTVKWGLRQRVHSTESILTKSTSDGITVSGTDITIKLSPADTLSLAGTYYHECEVTDQLNNVSTIFTGMVTISKSGV